MRLPRLLRNSRHPCELQCRDLKVRRIRTPELLSFVCDVEHPSEAVDVNEFWVLLLLLMLPDCTSFVYAKKRSVCTASDGSCFDNDESAVPFMGKDTPSPSSEFPIQTYPTISRAMDALDVYLECTVRKMYVRSLDLFDLTMLFRWSLCSMPCANPSCCAILLVHLAKHGTFDHNGMCVDVAGFFLRGWPRRLVRCRHAAQLKGQEFDTRQRQTTRCTWMRERNHFWFERWSQESGQIQ